MVGSGNPVVGLTWRRLAITPDQLKKMDEILQQPRLRLIELNALAKKRRSSSFADHSWTIPGFFRPWTESRSLGRNWEP